MADARNGGCWCSLLGRGGSISGSIPVTGGLYKISLQIQMRLTFALFSCVTFVAALPKVLIFSRTLGYRHDSIPAAISALISHGSDANIQFETTEDPTKFTSSYLAQYDGILFLMTTDSNDTTRVEILNSDQKVGTLNRVANFFKPWPLVRLLAVFVPRWKLHWHPQCI